MDCPYCHADKDSLKVIDSRGCDGGRSIRRRRECEQCRKRFTTYERIEDPVRLTVVKRDGRRVPWDREKILVGLERACFKLPIAEAELIRIVDEIEEDARRHHDREVPTTFIGEAVIERLRRLDQVAYVRFASVYRKFKTVEDLISEAQAVIDAKRFEDPTQGRLFIDDKPVSIDKPATPGKTPNPRPRGGVRKKPAKAPGGSPT
jgi:transcriptional repressor NrdR